MRAGLLGACLVVGVGVGAAAAGVGVTPDGACLVALGATFLVWSAVAPIQADRPRKAREL